MELNYFEDKIFELLNEADNMEISDIDTYDKEDKFVVSLKDGSVFEIKIHQKA